VSVTASARRDDAPPRLPAVEPAPEVEAVRSAIRAVRNGDREAFGPLVERYQGRVFGLTLMVIRNPSGAEEVTQDAFVRAFTHLDRYDLRRPFYPWLATIAVRLAQNWLRRRARVTEHEGAELFPESSPAPAPDPLSDLITDERDRRLWRSVEALPLGERAAVLLYYRQEMKVADVARVLGVTTGTVKTLLFRARGKLRRAAAGALNATSGKEHA
jgi:RNA polymerase sigma-70 factor (ECF subfamily)